MAKAAGTRPYLYELDPIRAVTALGVIGVHVGAGTLIFYHTAIGYELQNAVVTALHFTREIFLTLTAFVLTYTYARKPFAWKTFWRKRGIGVLVPYVIWSFFYVWFAVPRLPFGRWLGTAAFDTLTGNASYQLYYILLTLEFYAILPAFLWLLQRLERHPWITLGISCAVQVVLLYVDYHYIQTGPLARTAFGQFVNTWQNRILFVYQFSILLGAMAALYLRQVRAFVVRHGWWITLGLVVGLGLHWLHYWALVIPNVRDANYAISALQPTMLAYSLAIAVFLYWLACRWAMSAPPNRAPRGHTFWLAIGNASFGIYLIHAFILTTLVLPHLAPVLPATWPAPLRALTVWLVVAASTTGITLTFLYTPGLSRLVGRPCLLAPTAPQMRALAATRRFISAAWTGRSASRGAPQGNQAHGEQVPEIVEIGTGPV